MVATAVAAGANALLVSATTSISSQSAVGSRGVVSCSLPSYNGVSCSRLPSTSQPRTHKLTVPTRSRVVCSAKPETAAAGVVTDATFKELVLESKVPVLVDFWAPWCGPCRMIAPLIDELAATYAGKLVCLKMNTDESPGVATEYGIRSIPTVMIFKGGKKLDTVIGAVPKTTLTTTIEKFLN